jgi:nucleoside-diphosphate kinase
MASSLTAAPGEATFAFKAEFLDPVSSILHTYHIAVFEKDGTVEVFDPKARRTVLKRCKPKEGVTVDDFFVGNTVTVMSRAYLVKQYLNSVTHSRFSTARGTSCVVVKPDGLKHMGSILDEVMSAGFDIGAMRLVKLSRREAEEFYETATKHPHHAAMVDHLCSDAILACIVSAGDVVSRLHGFAGPADPSVASETSPASIR